MWGIAACHLDCIPKYLSATKYTNTSVSYTVTRLNEHFEQSGLLPEKQCGFRKDKGTIDMIYTAQQLQEKCQEQNVDLYITFVDLTKASDTVTCKRLWKIMAKFGCPAKFIAMVRQFHDGMPARVQNDSEFSKLSKAVY